MSKVWEYAKVAWSWVAWAWESYEKLFYDFPRVAAIAVAGYVVYRLVF